MYHSSRAMSLLELLTTIALLTIVMGLMLSLARYVRSDSADRATRQLLREVAVLLSEYQTANNASPVGRVLDDSVDVTEEQFAQVALYNNAQLVRALHTLSAPSSNPDALVSDGIIRDAWGTPLAYMSRMHRQIGLATGAFVVSAGPDRKFLTRDDNLYSYEDFSAPTAPSTLLPTTGQSE